MDTTPDPLRWNAALTSNSEDKDQIQGEQKLLLLFKTLDERILKLEVNNLSKSKEIDIIKKQLLASEQKNQIKIDELLEKNKDLTDQLNGFKRTKNLEIQALQNYVTELQKNLDDLNEYQNIQLLENYHKLQSKQERMDEEIIETKKLYEDHIFSLEELQKNVQKLEQESHKHKNELLKHSQNFETKFKMVVELRIDELVKRIQSFETKLQQDELHWLVKKEDNFTNQHDVNKILQDIPILQTEVFLFKEQLHELLMLQNKINDLEKKIQQEKDNMLIYIKCLIQILNKEEAGTNEQCKKYLNNNLIDASYNGQVDIVTLLLDLGSVADAKDNNMIGFIKSHLKLFGQSVESNHQICCELINIVEETAVLSFEPDELKRSGLYVAALPLSPYHKYFEIEILETGLIGSIGIGLVPLDYDLYAHPGWNEGSIGYHADDGQLFKAFGKGEKFGPLCSIGDRMGCGIKFEQISSEDLHLLKSVPVYFTWNGNEIGTTIDWPWPEGGLFPAVGMHSEGEKIKLHLNESNGQTSLHYAAGRGHMGVVNELLNHNADTRCKDNAGKTALDLATEFGRNEVAQILKLNGAS